MNDIVNNDGGTPLPDGRPPRDTRRGELEQYINRSRLEPFTKGVPTNAYILQVVDDKGDRQPLLVKIVLPHRQRLMDDMERSNRIFREQLGDEFVENATRVTVTNREGLEALRNRLNLPTPPPQLDGFVQNLRGVNGMQDLWTYLVTKQGEIEPTTRHTIATFLTRLLTGIREGYGFDLGHFPAGLTADAISKRLAGSNLIIDDKGVAVIDTGLLTHDDPPRSVSLIRTIAFDAARLGTLLLTDPTTQYDPAQDAVARPGRMRGITQEYIESETPELLSRLSTIH